ncbi:MAG: serpin family protein [Armatimonadota bacterium]|nr:serpin family protein [bacterium]MDW8321445.1 serpin family protein [Armatimonadota bacterium]
MKPLWLLPVFVLLVGCGNVATTGVGNEPAPRPNTGNNVTDPTRKVDQRLIEANNGFGFALLQQLREADAGKNLFFSPISITLALAMTYNGASGETEQAMAKTLSLEGMSKEELNQAVLHLRQSLQNADAKVELTIANSLWARQGVSFKRQFLDTNRQYFGAQVSVLDFAGPDAPQTINHWVESNTKGKIKKIVDRIPPDTVMFLLNAIYFHGKWQKPFDKSLTQEKPFHLANGEQKRVPMMAQTGKFLYLKGEGFQMVSLPYGAGRYSMVIALPDEGVSLSEWLKSVEAKSWKEWTSRLVSTDGEVQLPRFKTEYEKTLNNALRSLGMSVAFEPDRADFTGMRDERDLYLQKVHHKAVVEVNEEGTEAAAVTSVQVGITSVQQPRPPFKMIVDRPFFFAIRDTRTGMVLFMGAVYEP